MPLDQGGDREGSLPLLANAITVRNELWCLTLGMVQVAWRLPLCHQHVCSVGMQLVHLAFGAQRAQSGGRQCVCVRGGSILCSLILLEASLLVGYV